MLAFARLRRLSGAGLKGGTLPGQGTGEQALLQIGPPSSQGPADKRRQASSHSR